MIGKNVKKKNFGLWISGQVTALAVAGLVWLQHDLSSAATTFFTICVLVDIRGQL